MKQVLTIAEFAATTNADMFISHLGERALVLEADNPTDYNEGVCHVDVRGYDEPFLFIDGNYYPRRNF